MQTPKWQYRPSAWKQRIPICIVASIAAMLAFYMGLYQWQLIDSVWDPVFKDQTRLVLDSDVSHTLRKWFRVPDSIMGSVAYLGDVIFALAGSSERWKDRPWLVVLFGIDVIPLGAVSATLVFLQGTVVGSYCFCCLITATISLLLIFLAFDEIRASLLYLRAVWNFTKSRRAVWDAFCGRASQIAAEAAARVISEREKKGK